MTKLRLASNLTLPIDAVTQAIGILAKRRAGKSYTARRFAEQLFKAGQQIVIVDPKGDWWGVRSSADGKSPGLPVVILGGERGDVPLEVGSGEVVAKLVTEERVSVLLDLSLFRKHEVSTFMTAFLETLYRLKAREEFRTPLMLFIDEADAIAPQKPQENQARMLGAAEDIVRRGGQRGIGCTMISQRSAVLNKNVLTQVELLIALRTIAPQDLKAMDAWIEVHGEKEQRDILMASLPALPQGDAWFWSPGWPTTSGIFERVRVLPIETFDSGASPKAGEKRKEPKNLADVDLGALQRQMAATIAKAKADDPKELRKRIAELEKAAKTAPARTVEKAVADPRAVERAVAAAVRPYKEALRGVLSQHKRLVQYVGSTRSKVAALDADLGTVWTTLDVLLGTTVVSEAERTEDARIAGQVSNRGSSVPAVGQSSRAPARPAAPSRTPVDSAEGVSPSMQRILNALAALEVLGVAEPRRVNVAFFAGYTENGHFNNMLGTLRTMGLLDYPAGARVKLTDTGRASADASAGAFSSLAELHRVWLGKVSPSEAKLLGVLIERYPEPIERAALAEASGYTENGHFNNMLGHLRTLGVADYPGNRLVVATDVLFPEGLD